MVQTRYKKGDILCVRSKGSLPVVHPLVEEERLFLVKQGNIFSIIDDEHIMHDEKVYKVVEEEFYKPGEFSVIGHRPTTDYVKGQCFKVKNRFSFCKKVSKNGKDDVFIGSNNILIYLGNDKFLFKKHKLSITELNVYYKVPKEKIKYKKVRTSDPFYNALYYSTNSKFTPERQQRKLFEQSIRRYLNITYDENKARLEPYFISKGFSYIVGFRRYSNQYLGSYQFPYFSYAIEKVV